MKLSHFLLLHLPALFMPSLVAAFSFTTSFSFSDRLSLSEIFSSSLKSHVSCHLPSCFPVTDEGEFAIPPGVRGEAVRNAIDRRGICVNLSDMNVGVVRVRGKGTTDFLNNKFTNTFPPPPFSPQRRTIEGRGVTLDVMWGASREACLLTTNGHVVDRILVPYFAVREEREDGENFRQEEAFLITSPDNFSEKKLDEPCRLFRKLDPLVFPMDDVKLSDRSGFSDVILIASSSLEKSRDLIIEHVLKSFIVDDNFFHHRLAFNELLPEVGGCVLLSLSPIDLNCRSFLCIMEGTPLPYPCRGYTILVQGDAGKLWNAISLDDKESEGERLVMDDRDLGPLAIGAMEWETLRVEHCLPALGREMMGYDEAPDMRSDGIKVGPLELNLGRNLIDMEKGCYLGQEGVSAMAKNKRGVPRKLYAVVFPECDNDSPDDEEGKTSATAAVSAGDELFLLGSNESARVGVVTSVEPDEAGGGIGRPERVAMALVRRPQSIMRKVEELGLDFNPSSVDEKDGKSSQLIFPDDPLHGLEVIAGGTTAVGTLRAVSSRLGKGLENSEETVDEQPSSVMGFTSGLSSPLEKGEPIAPSRFDSEDVDAEMARIEQEAKKAVEVANEAAAEARRKAEKLEVLRQRAEAAMAARRGKKKKKDRTQQDG